MDDWCWTDWGELVAEQERAEEAQEEVGECYATKIRLEAKKPRGN